MVAEFWQDLRYGARMLVKNSGFDKELTREFAARM